MKKIRAIIIDDESAARDVLENLLLRTSPLIEILDKCVDLEQGVASIKLHNPDVVFLDVQMPNYAGYEIARFFDEITFDIVFVTAYDQYAIKAFELSAIDYLVKPINRQRLKEAVEKLTTSVQKKRDIEHYQILLHSIREKDLGKIIISELGNKRVLQLNKIHAFEANGAYTKIHVEGEQPILVSKNLKHFESVLPEQKTFFRSHKSWLINLDKIESISKGVMEITLKENLVTKLSKYKTAELENALTNHNQ